MKSEPKVAAAARSQLKTVVLGQLRDLMASDGQLGAAKAARAPGAALYGQVGSATLTRSSSKGEGDLVRRVSRKRGVRSARVLATRPRSTLQYSLARQFAAALRAQS